MAGTNVQLRKTKLLTAKAVQLDYRTMQNNDRFKTTLDIRTSICILVGVYRHFRETHGTYSAHKLSSTPL